MPLARLEHRYRVFAICATGIFTTVFDTSAAVVALPTIALEFGTDLPTAQWVIIGNALTIAALLVPMGRLSDLIGRKRIYVIGCVLFALGALLATLAGSVHALIGARVFVGIGSAMTQGTAMAILVGNFAFHERARMLGLQMGAVGLGAIAGPAIGGFLVGAFGWRALFAVTVVAMLSVAISAQRTLRPRAQRPDPSGPPFDFAGALLFATALAAGLLTLTLGPRAGWTTPGTLTGVAVFTATLASFVVVEKRSTAPMLDFALFRNRAFAHGALGAVVVFMGLSATRFLAPFFFQAVRGFDPSQVGLLLLPAAAVTAVAAPFIGRFAERFGVRRVANLGFAVSIAGLVVFAWLDTETPTSAVVIGLMILALGMSAFGAPNSTSILNAVEADSHGVAASFVNLCRNTGNVIGIAFGTAVVTLTMARAGLPASLAAVEAGAGGEVLVAFTRGVQLASIALILLTVPVLAILVIATRSRP